jgi:hypothetical protein
MLNQFLIILLSVLGILGGYALTKIAPEELKPGRRYFLFADKVLILFVFIPIIYFSFITPGLKTLSIVLIVTAFIFALGKFSKARLILLYIVFILLEIFLNREQTLFLTTASVIFVYGLVAGTLVKKN